MEENICSNSLSEYEKNQGFNRITSFFHNVRYRHLIKFFERFPANKAIKVVDIGCAHAKTFCLLKDRFSIAYIGIEPSELGVYAYQRYSSHKNFRIINGLVEDHFLELKEADVILALETLEHIPENIVVRIIEQISLTKSKNFICSVPNEIGPIVWVKNIASLLMGYIRHTEYTWRETFFAGIYKLDRIEAHTNGHKGFDWRWLAQTLRHNMVICKTYSSPVSWLPKILSPSLFFICRPK
jgi:SAM-dependent methyltransferase